MSHEWPQQEKDTHYRLWGTNLVNFLDYELTGKSPRIYMEPPFEHSGGYDQLEFDFLEYLVKQSAIGTALGSLNFQNRSYTTYEELNLPLADKGQSVDKLLFVLKPIIGLRQPK